MEENRPDPNKILAAIRTSQSKCEGGKLYIFLGMCPGVGKTYAMLQHAQEALADKKDVVVAVVETHGRGETARLLQGLPAVAKKEIQYRDKTFHEMDLEAVLQRCPEIAVVDELAHTNLPGNRHQKRWQDVEELLNNGINVYTTVNIQHVESRKEDVELITGISMHETVPDSIFERANQIELIDLPPEQLLERLNEGKVYLPRNIDFAAQNFFKPEKLTALRELSLRFAGDVVGNELDTLHVGMTSFGSHKEKILILLFPDLETKKVIRAARKVAFTSDGEVYALLMDRNNNLDEKSKEMLLSNADLVRNLNGEVLTAIDTDRFIAIKNVIYKYGITRVIVRKSQTSLLADIFMGGSLVTRLLKETQVDVQILRNTSIFGAKRRFDVLRNIYLETNPSRYYRVLTALALVTMLNIIICRYSGYLSVGFIYLLLVLGVSLAYSLGPIMLCAAGSMLAWNFFFIPPVFTLKITQSGDFIMSVAYLVTAVVTSVLTHKISTNQRLLRQREERSEVMLRIAQALNNAPADPHDTFVYIAQQLKRLLPGSFAFVYKTASGGWESVNSHPFGYAWFKSEKESSVGAWSMKNNISAGWNTDTLSMSEALYVPLYTKDERVGFMSFMPDTYDNKLSVEDTAFLKSAASQMGTYLYKEMLKMRAAKSEKLEEAQKVYQVVLNTVSHELKTPLTVISGAISVLKQNQGNSPESLEDLQVAALNLTHEINNILDISKINSNMELTKEWNDLQDIIYSCLEKLKNYASAHHLETDFQADLPFARVNFALMESAISNLIVNAVNYTPAGSLIKISSYVKDGHLCVEVADNGAGLPDDELGPIFDKFYRARQSSALKSGTGLGLFISKSVAEMHGGSVRAFHNQPAGLKVVIELPLEEQPKL